uniref:TNT domain-containing protein n=1 Tax=Saccharopolyspora galaxeae TaxID=2781241 RepID=UPI00190E19AB|nr:TNT domain-containing protein [Saccharopolyspora sp. HNM0986]
MIGIPGSPGVLRARGVRLLLALFMVLSAGMLPALPAHAEPEPCTGVHQGDERLGPENLPAARQRPVGPLLAGYSRTGELSTEDFLDRYWDPGADSWRYPPQDGFAVGPDGAARKHPQVLRAGTDLDRFGSEFGSFLAPAGDHYAERSLPPQSLLTREPRFPCGYHEYEVARDFTAWQGEIAPWFAQRGGGQQILLDPAFLDPGQGQRLNVRWLVAHGYLEPAG